MAVGNMQSLERDVVESVVEELRRHGILVQQLYFETRTSRPLLKLKRSVLLVMYSCSTAIYCEKKG